MQLHKCLKEMELCFDCQDDLRMLFELHLTNNSTGAMCNKYVGAVQLTHADFIGRIVCCVYVCVCVCVRASVRVCMLCFLERCILECCKDSRDSLWDSRKH